jgi:trans-L-3-hydroxyproline dehydratase
MRPIQTIDMHTAGEPLRIISGGIGEPEGTTILEKRRWLKDNADHIRKTLMWEPRGHADMYGCIITEPERDDSDFGAIFIHNEGYSTMCGHAIVALARYASDEGLCEDPIRIKIDAPAGQIPASYADGKSSFINVPSFASSMDQSVDIAGHGSIAYDIASGGAIYAFVDAGQVGFSLTPDELPEIVRLGREIKAAVRSRGEPQHPAEPDLSFLYGVIFTGPSAAAHSRHVCVFADGEVDRSPTGTGVSARAALLHARGELSRGEMIQIESILGTQFSVEIESVADYYEIPSVETLVSGSAFYTGRSEFNFEQDDPLAGGFLLR